VANIWLGAGIGHRVFMADFTFAQLGIHNKGKLTGRAETAGTGMAPITIGPGFCSNFWNSA